MASLIEFHSLHCATFMHDNSIDCAVPSRSFIENYWIQWIDSQQYHQHHHRNCEKLINCIIIHA